MGKATASAAVDQAVKVIRETMATGRAADRLAVGKLLFSIPGVAEELDRRLTKRFESNKRLALRKDRIGQNGMYSQYYSAKTPDNPGGLYKQYMVGDVSLPI